jgi:hypothetical protein
VRFHLQPVRSSFFCTEFWPPLPQFIFLCSWAGQIPFLRLVLRLLLNLLSDLGAAGILECAVGSGPPHRVPVVFIFASTCFIFVLNFSSCAAKASRSPSPRSSEHRGRFRFLICFAAQIFQARARDLGFRLHALVGTIFRSVPDSSVLPPLSVAVWGTSSVAV